MRMCCLHIQRKDKEQTVLMIRTNNKPYTRFTFHSGILVNRSTKTLKEILANSMNDIKELREIENNVNDEKN